VNTVNTPDTCGPTDGFQDGKTTASGNSGTMDKRQHLTHGALRKTIVFVKRGIQNI
jgi:hypothetical protein